MDEEKRKTEFRKISEKYNTEISEYSEKQDHIHKITLRCVISLFLICMILYFIGIIISLNWLMVIVLILSLISIILLTITLIHSTINTKKKNKKWDEYIKDIEKLLKKEVK